MSKLLATKPLDQLLAEARSESSHSLVRALGPYNLISLGIGAVIGAGIFVFTGTAAAQFAGPAITLSFALAGVGCAFAGLCYAEFAAMIPISGSAYTYGDRKSIRLNSSHLGISYAVFCLKKKRKENKTT